MQARFYDLERQMGADDMRRYIYDNAEVLLPNSQIEYTYLQTISGPGTTMSRCRMRSIPRSPKATAKPSRRNSAFPTSCCAAPSSGPARTSAA